jgi:lipopolysaccharide heptosyltransferase II
MPAPMPDPRRILILSPNWLGDAVMALPAIADVRRRYQGARLIVAARRSVADLFALTPDVNDVVVLEWKGQALRVRSLNRDIAALRRVEADIALLLPNAFSAAWLVSRAGIRERWGYAADLRRPMLSRAIARPRRSVHQAEYYQHLVRELGIETGPLEPSLTVPQEAIVAARTLLTAKGWDASRPLVAVAPGAAYGTAKRWLPEHYATLLTKLVRTGAHCVLVGSASDTETTTWILGLVPATERAHVIDLSGATTLSSLAGVIAIAKTFVSNDSGAMHVASAVGAPVAAVFGPTREYETRPLPRHGARADVLIHPVWCRPCMLRECPIDHRCMKGLSPERVFASVSSLMADPPGPKNRTRPTPS